MTQLYKNPVSCFFASLLFFFSHTSNATLVNGSILNIGSGSTMFMQHTPGTPDYAGFYLGHQMTAVGTGGIKIGSTQASGDISVWNWTGTLAYEYTTSPIQILSASGNTATLDMSGWTLDFGGQIMDVSTGAWNDLHGGWTGNTDGVAQITCGLDCGNGDTYILQYTATIPEGTLAWENIGFGWEIHGTISAVPVPAAVWLFLSGFIVMAGFAKRSK